MLGFIGAFWGLGGVIALLGYSVAKLSKLVIEMFAHGLNWYHWLVLALNVIFMAYSEGYRGFQQAFSPRVAARAKYLYHHPTLTRVALAPLFCMGYFYIQTRKRVAILVLTGFIILLIVLIRWLEQPWRGIVDAGVVVGLSWGLISLIIFGFQACTSDHFSYSPETPEDHPSTS